MLRETFFDRQKAQNIIDKKKYTESIQRSLKEGQNEIIVKRNYC